MPDHDPDDRTRSHLQLAKDTEVGHYLILERIGAGGMGEVYLARDTKLNRKVALKFIPPYLSGDEASRQRFIREAQSAANLNHPNIVTVYEVGEFRERPFYAMELVEGRTLKEVISLGGLSVPQIVEWVIQLADGLQTAHESGVTHRDIKPSNIVIDKKGRPRLVDFGLASVRGAERITQTGSTLGTVGYMSPEQIRGEHVDQRSDLFSLGVILYELATGRNPFLKDSDTATLRAVLDDDPPPVARYRADTPDGLQEIVDRALAKDAAKRYQHADEMLADLQRFKQSLSLSGPTALGSTRPPARFRWGWVVTAVVLVAVAGVLLMTRPWERGEEAERETGGDRIMIAVLPFENLGNPDDEYFADGMTEEITSRLASVSSLGVISRTSIIGYKGTDKSVPEIGRELGVDYVLEGTVRFDKSSDPPRVRITPQLIRTADDVHLWADQVDMPLNDVFQVQARIARDIVEALDVRLVQGEPEWIERIPTQSTEAYQLLLQARHYVQTPGVPLRDKLDSVNVLAQKALEFDSTIVMGWVIISGSHSIAYHYGWDKSPECRKISEDAARTAIQLDPKSPEAHFAMGQYYYRCVRDYNRALEEFEKAMKNPIVLGDPAAAIAYILRRQGRFKEALDRQLEHFRLNPRSESEANEIALTYGNLRKYEKADVFYRKAIDLAPNNSAFYINAAYNMLVWHGDVQGARELIRRAPEVGTQDFRLTELWRLSLYERDLKSALAYLDSLNTPFYITQGNYWPRALFRALAERFLGGDTTAAASFQQAKEMLTERLAENPDDFRIHIALGYACAGLGQKSDALRHANRAKELCSVERDALLGAGVLADRTDVEILVGDYHQAITDLENLMNMPAGNNVSVSMLRLRPIYDPLRDSVRFQALLQRQ